MALGSLVFRCLLGGSLVSLFAAIGSSFKPKTFAGLFGAAPPIALASLAVAFHEHGSTHIALLGRSMVLGGLALFAYSLACAGLVRVERVPALLGAIGAWAGWAVVASALFFAWVR